MDIVLNRLAPYCDDKNNKILFNGPPIETGVRILFRGFNNTLKVNSSAKMNALEVRFGGNNSMCEIGNTGASCGYLLGTDCEIKVCDGLTTTGRAYITAAEGSKVFIGRDCMFAVGIQIRSDDGHPIFDVRTGNKINNPEDIFIGDHVWLGYEAAILSGSHIESGSVIGFRSVVKSKIPNNCVAVGAPARVVRKNIAWERPHLALTTPGYKPDVFSINTDKKYWNETKISRDQRPWWWRILARVKVFRMLVRRIRLLQM